MTNLDSSGDISHYDFGVILGSTGGLSVSMEGPAKPEIRFKHNDDGTTSVLWKPPNPGDYKINVKFADQPIPGSPFAVNVPWS